MTDPNRIMSFEQRINAVTPAKLSQIARKFYTNKNIFTAKWVPETTE
jgi:predicted Zn-dependent peptidase